MMLTIILAVMATFFVAAISVVLLSFLSEGDEFQQGVTLTIAVPFFFFIIFSAVWQWFGWIGGW